MVDEMHRAAVNMNRAAVLDPEDRTRGAQTVHVRLTDDELAVLDAEVARQCRAAPAAKLSRSAVLRSLVWTLRGGTTAGHVPSEPAPAAPGEAPPESRPRK